LKFLTPNFKITLPVGSALIHEDRRTDATNVISVARLDDVTQVSEYHSMNIYL
jgi:hypothetical protein